MFKKIKVSFMKFINADVKDESESKELAVLLRVLSLIFGLYYTVMSIIVAALGYYNLSFVLLFILGVSTAIFICTYENKTQFSLYLFDAVIIIASSFLTLEVGFSLNYHWTMFLTILLTFYNIKTPMKRKFLYSFLIIFLTTVVTVISYAVPTLRAPSLIIRIFVVLLNIAVFAFSIITIAYFYCSKYTASEDKILQYNKKLLKMASTDALTTLANRRSMNEHLQDLVFSSSRTGKPFSVSIGDIDFFKRINDQYGHDTGDYVLSKLSDIFIQELANEGLIARWGGEEFLFTFENSTLEQAFHKLESLLHTIKEYNFSYKENSFHISMTFGLEEYNGQFGIESVISKADSKLYAGKKNGRSKVVY